MTGTKRIISAPTVSERLLLCALAILATTAVPAFAVDTIVPADKQLSDVETRAELAHCEAALGHLESARAQYRTLLQTTNVSWRIRLSFAETSVLWGDFRGSTDM